VDSRRGSLYGIEVREYGAITLVELRGELDLFTLFDLRKTLNRLLVSMRPTLLDLSGVTFLDLESARELAVRCQLYANFLTLRNPSAEVRASVAAFELGEWISFHPGSDREEPPLVSEASS
jgi:anti-anti-sigma factor